MHRIDGLELEDLRARALAEASLARSETGDPERGELLARAWERLAESADALHAMFIREVLANGKRLFQPASSVPAG